MYVHRLLKRLPGNLILVGVLALLVAACGTTTASTNTSASTTTTTTACAPTRFRATTGTLQSVNGTTLVMTDKQGKSVTATYNSNTRFMRQSTVATSALQEGAPVTVGVTQNADNTYTATLITLRTRNAAPGGNNFGNGNGQPRNAACSQQGRTGTPGTGKGTSGAGTTTLRAINGTVGQLNGNTLTVTSQKGDDYTVTLSSATQVMQTQTASASDLQSGMNVSIVGTTDNQNAITAQAVTILLPGSKGGITIGG